MIGTRRVQYPVALFLWIVACTTSHLRAQSAQTDTVSPDLATFDVASIRSSAAEATGSHISHPVHNGEFNAVNVTVRDLLEVAFALPETQMLGGPDWTATERFDIKARTGPAVAEQLAALPADQAKLRKRQMLQALLADRFKVSAHAEDRDMRAFALAVAKGGPKLVSTNSAVTDLTGGRGLISIKGGNDSLAVLAFELSWRLGRPVVDRTGLQGRYEIKLTWSADDGASGTTPETSDASLFTAIQEQLGLKLEPYKGPVPVLILDHAEKPSEN